MGWFRRKERAKPSPAAPSGPTLEPDAVAVGLDATAEELESAVDLDLAMLREALERQLPHVLEQGVDRVLVHARLADAYRGKAQEPPPADRFLELVRELDEEAWRRLALLVALLDLEPCRESLRELQGSDGVPAQVEQAFVAFARDTELLTVATLRRSELRREELLRRWLLRLGAGVAGETVAESLARLDRLDYGKLLGEAERAQLIAQERMAYLKKLQDVEDASRRPRGKW